MKFLITGITGFAGPHLARLLLREGHTVCGLVRSSNGRQFDLLDTLSNKELETIEWVYGELTNYPSLERIFKKYEFDGVFHLAAQSHPPTSFLAPISTFNTNVMGSLNLVTCVERHQKDCRFHFCSSSEVYGDICKETKILKEDSRIEPANPYGVSKAAIDLYVQERIRNKFITGFVTRAFSHTGPRRGCTFSISSDAYQIARMKLGLQDDKTLLIGNLETQRVVMDVRDCVRAYYLLMLQKEAKGVYNVCGNNVHKMQFFTDELIRLSGIKNIVQKIHRPFYRPIDIQVQIGDITRLTNIINWKTEVSLEKTLSDLLKYWIKKLKTKG